MGISADDHSHACRRHRLPFFINNKKGEPMLSLPSANDLLPDSNATANLPLPGTTTQVFKWQDAEGVWHYGDAPPEGNASVQTVSVDTRTNVIQSFKQEQSQTKASDTVSPVENMTPPGEDFLTLDRAMNVMKDAKLAAEAMELRNQHLNNLVGEEQQK